MAKALDSSGDSPAGNKAKSTETTSGSGGGKSAGRPARGKKSKGSGRPDLSKLDLVEERVEILDPALEGTAERIGFGETHLLGRRRACSIRAVMARATYKIATPDENPPGESVIESVTANKPKEIYERGMLAPSFIAYLLTKKFRGVMPFHRICAELSAEGLAVDDSTMCR